MIYRVDNSIHTRCANGDLDYVMNTIDDNTNINVWNYKVSYVVDS